MDSRAAGILGASIVVAALLLAWLSRGADARPGDVRPIIQAADANLLIDYMVQTSPTTAEGSRQGEVASIEFFANYIVVRQKGGSGRVFFADRTRSLSWSMQPKTETKPAEE